MGPGVVTDDQWDKLPRIEFCPEASTGATEAAEGLEWQAFTQLNLDTGQPRRHLVFVQEFLLRTRLHAWRRPTTTSRAASRHA